MQIRFLTAFLYAAYAAASPLEDRQTSCSSDAQIAAVKAEIATIRSHSAADAAKIPLTPLASRTFFVTPDELNAVAVPVNVGVTAGTVRAELVVLATALDADVPQGSDKYQVNSNNTVTVDYIQTNRIALPEVQVREIHSIDTTTCRISKIVGYVRGPLTAITAGLDLGGILS